MSDICILGIAFAIISFYIAELLCRKIERLEIEIQKIKENLQEGNNDQKSS